MYEITHAPIGSCPACHLERQGVKRLPGVPHLCEKRRPVKPRHDIYIGIDTGTNTGIAVYAASKKELIEVRTGPIHMAMETVRYYWEKGYDLLIRVEDARLRKWVPKITGRERLQGAGSIKRDAAIWEDFLKDLGIPFEMVAPKQNKTKMSAEYFRKATGWTGRCSSHGRDAAMLVYGF